MKVLLFLIISWFHVTPVQSEAPKDAMVILNAWIETQNKGTDEAISSFIKTYYAPEVLNKMKNFDDHLKFYRQVIDEFGPIQKVIFEEMESTETKLKVQLLKQGTPLVPTPEPEEILVVEIDLDAQNPKFIEKGLGMGALICYIKR
ncbi:hypothetical protein [Roseivirga sp. E12]|uniref:hypothetical protein n=1 Tax=Roseivirga sp. E12 TaxID=2819237 RepID=UPI001ABC0779|nr:hypothetical protein [Roseivirga sp. E12]MBO3698806.1 hypothetical protein [Roseivirga sp. E12]